MQVFIYGATGFTGALIAEALRARGIRLVLSGRDPRRLDELAARLRRAGANAGADAQADDGSIEVRPAQVHDADALRAAMAGCKLVVSCAGPFSRVGEPVVAAAIDTGAHYLDITGEQAFMRDIYERYESAARKAGVVVVSGMAFEIALGDLAAHLCYEALGTDEPADEIVVAYALSQFRPSAGTRASIVANLAAPACEWSVDRWDAVSPAAERRLVSFGAELGSRTVVSFPSGEVISVPQHCPVKRVQTYVSLDEAGPVGNLLGRLAPVTGPFLGALVRSPLGAYVRSLAASSIAEPTAADRAYSRFAVVAEARQGFACQRMLLRGSDVYGLTAVIAGLAAEELLGRRDLLAGVRAPAEVFDAQAMLAQIGRRWPLVIEASFP